MNIDVLQEKAKSLKNLREEKVIEEKGVLSLIKDKSLSLEKRKKERQAINELNKDLDNLLVSYMEEMKFPNELDETIITYKALFFYFKKHFIENKQILYIGDYLSQALPQRGAAKDIFREFFGENGEIHIDIKETNFPHLIGYQVQKRNEYGQRIKNENRTFLDRIYYEVDLIEDYVEHDCSLDKMKCMSWIKETLLNPNWILNSFALTNKTMIDTDLLFIKKSGNVYHYVSLIKENPRTSLLNVYIINSHHKISVTEVKGTNKKFDLNKAIYTKRRS